MKTYVVHYYDNLYNNVCVMCEGVYVVLYVNVFCLVVLVSTPSYAIICTRAYRV